MNRNLLMSSICAASIMALLLASATLLASGWRINVSQSLPGWIYKTVPIDQARPGDYVSFCRPVPIGNIPRGACPDGSMPLLKRVIAASGQDVRFGRKMIEVGERQVFRAIPLERDSRGTPLPRPIQGLWFKLAPGQVVVWADHNGSVDSRYFGPIGGPIGGTP